MTGEERKEEKGENSSTHHGVRLLADCSLPDVCYQGTTGVHLQQEGRANGLYMSTSIGIHVQRMSPM